MCENTHTSYWERFGGGLKRSKTFIEFAKDIVDQLNVRHIHDKSLLPTYVSENCLGIHFYDSIVILDKSNFPLPEPVTTGKGIHFL
ncbi:MAG: hypothetical protein Harvfovirus6_48 [Harvfovirus sp.]|uniref:Uncharacterized protein n=1 Tax=Harvfovirus sp. TaxID=2487768 RepID=A0A3G5A0S9_9VIRU|nr:MAG: hypothetical protein Harvfovirus6_48 [Harvfovirus sp.]